VGFKKKGGVVDRKRSGCFLRRLPGGGGRLGGQKGMFKKKRKKNVRGVKHWGGIKGCPITPHWHQNYKERGVSTKVMAGGPVGASAGVGGSCGDL